MKIASVFLLLALTSSLQGATSMPNTPANSQFAIVQGNSYLGAIVPAERVGDAVPYLGVKGATYWTPNAEVVAALEAKLGGALESGLHAPDDLVPGLKPGREFDYVAKQIAYVLEKLATSRRQYIGIVLPNGSKRILVNGFPDAHGPAPDPFPYWRDRIVWVMDGGASFWRIQYVVNEGRFTEFDSNGYA